MTNGVSAVSSYCYPQRAFNGQSFQSTTPVIQPYNGVFANPQPVKKKSSISNILIGAGLGIAGIITVCLAGPRAMYAIRNIGKKGIQNFMSGNSDKALKDVIQKVSKNPEIKSALEEMGTGNIRKIAEMAKTKGAANIMATEKGYSGAIKIGGKVEPLLDFRNKRGFECYKEVSKAKEVAETINTIEKALNVGKKSTKGLLKCIKVDVGENNQFTVEGFYGNKASDKVQHLKTVGEGFLGKGWEYTPEFIRHTLIRHPKRPVSMILFNNLLNLKCKN